MAFNQTWNDAFEDVPADGDQIKFGADKIRDLKEGMRERLQIDHEMGEADGAGTDTGVDTGYHKKVTLKVATPGTPAAGYIELGSAADEFYWKGAGGTLRTIADLAKAQTLTNKTLTSPVLNSPDINTPDIDGGTIDGATIAGNTISGGSVSGAAISGGTVASATISGSPISGSTGSFTTLAASALATLSAGAVLGSGTVKIAVLSGTLGMGSGGSLGYFQNIAHGVGTAARAALGAIASGASWLILGPSGTTLRISTITSTAIQVNTSTDLTGSAYYIICFYV